MPRPKSSASTLTATPAASAASASGQPGAADQKDADITAESEEHDAAEIDVAGIADHQVQIAGEDDVDGGEHQALAQLDVVVPERRATKAAMIATMTQKNGFRKKFRKAMGAFERPSSRTRKVKLNKPRGKAIRTRTNSTNSMTEVQLTGMKGVARPSISPSAMPPKQRARRVAEPAQNGDDEALELVSVARQHGEGEQRGDQRARDAGERDAEAEGERQHARGRNADQFRRHAVAGDGADRLAGAASCRETEKAARR